MADSCPKCGYEKVESDECLRCRVIVSKYRAYLSQKEHLHGRQPLFFQVSPLKLAIMSFVTFGLYEVYWFYKHWCVVKERTGRQISPFWRAAFPFIFCYSLIKEVRLISTQQNVAANASAGVLALVYVLLSSAWRLPDPIWLIALLSFLPLVIVQSEVDEVHTRFGLDPRANSRLSGWNVTAVVLSGTVWLLSLTGIFVPE